MGNEMETVGTHGFILFKFPKAQSIPFMVAIVKYDFGVPHIWKLPYGSPQP